MQLRRPSAAVLGAAAALAALTGCTGAGPSAAAAPTPTASAAAVPTAAASVASTVATPTHTTTEPARTALTAHGFDVRLGLLTSTAAAAPAAALSTHTRGRLAGLTIVLDPGHNGANAANPRRLNAPVPAGGFTKPCNTAGAETNAGYPEHAFTWDVVERADRLLTAEGATVVLTRHSDTGFGPCVNIRAAIGNAAHADAVVAVHADGAAGSAYGFHVIAPSLAPDGGNRAILARSWALALAMHTQFHRVTGEAFSSYVANGLTRRDDLAGLNLSRVPAIFIECANMRNAGDASRLTSAAWRQKAASGIVAGLTAYLHR
ncbi:hypothetical protein acdb102_12560 [Acidothermaceae bacterium B102]|nr:hypothetical protein acdb102_12560 [Acidothermaceae bacterium B102]